MSLADRLNKIDIQPTSAQCLTCWWLNQQAAPDRVAFWAWIDEPRPLVQLYRECQSEGLDVGETSFRRHADNPKCRERTLNFGDMKRKSS